LLLITALTTVIQKVSSPTQLAQQMYIIFCYFWQSLMQLICTCSSFSPKNGFRCRKKTVVPGFSQPSAVQVIIKFASS